MKHIRFAMQQDRRTAVRLLLSVLIPCAVCLTSCTDESEGFSRSSTLSFTATVSENNGLSTRSEKGNGLPQDTVTAIEGYPTPLYLHTIHEDGIASDGTDSLSSGARPQTRAAAVTEMYNSFAVSAFRYTGEWSEDLMPNYFHNVTATVSTDGGYSLSSVYYWPGSEYNMKFFAYAPTGNSNCELSASTKKGSPTLTVNVPTDVAKQQDLLAAKPVEQSGDYRTDVALSFKHIMTAVKFVCGDDMQAGKVNSVTLKGIYSNGTYNMGTEVWSVGSTTTDFTQTLSKTTDGTEGSAITTDAQTFMMIPQTLSTGAQIEVKFTDNSNTEHTLKANIGSTIWTKGSTVTYKLSTSSINWIYTLDVTSNLYFYYYGGTNTYSVTSYKQNGSTTEAIPWTAQFSTDGGTNWTDTKPDWLTAFTTSGNGETTSTEYSATVVDDQSKSTHTLALRNATAKGTASSPYNLSNQTDGGSTVENTANCYVVSAPGYYSFPLVYGNAIKNSKTNSSAYTSTKTGTTILSKFINHLGNEISDPYISKNTGCTSASAELVWQDARNLVTDIKYNNTGSDGGNVSFRVDKSTIHQGNVVIAVKDASGNVLWSWHIWVTDEDLTKTIAVTNYSNETNDFMPVNLGWCDYEDESYSQRSCKVKFTAGSVSKELTITQYGGSVNIWVNSPYYQWGRKEPFLPADFSVSNETLSASYKIWYDKNGKASDYNTKIESAELGSGNEAIKQYILKPNTFQNTTSGDNTYYNLWSANEDATSQSKYAEKVVKTVYDPCPVGFTVPPGRAFTGFTSDGSGADDADNIKGKMSTDKNHYGYDFQINPVNENLGTIFFGYIGYRRTYAFWGNGASSQSSTYYWTAPALATSYCSSLMFNNANNKLWFSGCNKGSGCPIRPAKEIQ